jgi:hypothetical protein
VVKVLEKDMVGSFKVASKFLRKSSLFQNKETRKQKLSEFLTERDYDCFIEEFNWGAEALSLANAIVRFLFDKGDFFGTGVLLKKAVECESDPEIKKSLESDWESYRGYFYH